MNPAAIPITVTYFSRTSHSLFSAASQPDVVRALQKDQFYELVLREDLTELATTFGTLRIPYKREGSLKMMNFYEM